MRIPDTASSNHITETYSHQTSEHCLHLTQRVHKTHDSTNTWQNVLSHADISSEILVYFWNDGHNISTNSTTEATCPPWSWAVYFWSVHRHLLVCQQVTGNHQATLGSFQHSLTQYSWNKIRNVTPIRIQNLHMR